MGKQKFTISGALEELRRVEKDSSPTDKLLNSLALWLGILCFASFLIAACFALTDYLQQDSFTQSTQVLWFFAFFAIILFAFASIFFGSKQLIRQRFQSSFFGIVFSVSTLLYAIAGILLCAFRYGIIFVPFFYNPF